METLTKALLMPIIGFFIGYFTNDIAIKMLFYPKTKILGYQGLIPKKRKEIAKKISEVSPIVMPEYIKKIEKIPLIGPKIINHLKNSIEDEINKIPIEELEKIIITVTKKELIFITWIGGILGFFIGIIQALILYL